MPLDRWVRFHSLPESKRYPDSQAEYAIELDRHYTVLSELDLGSDLQDAQRADPINRISPLSCVGTTGFEPATP
jgi:hypothetical protein